MFSGTLLRRFAVVPPSPPLSKSTTAGRLFGTTAVKTMKHHLMAGTWTPPGAIFTFEFDDESGSLQLLKRTAIPDDEPISWMCFDHKKKNIYGSSMKKWSSYAVHSPTKILHEASQDMTHDPLAPLFTTNTRAIFCLAAHLPPYALYAFPFYSHAHSSTVISVTPTGTLSTPIQTVPLIPHAGIHGAVFDASETHLYSADLRANKIWAHRKLPDGTLELLEGGMVEAPEPSDHPRWVEISHCGKWLWVLMEAGNRLCEFEIEKETGVPKYTGRAWPLIPEVKRAVPEERKMYRADVVSLSHTGSLLYATSRANSFSLKGYISNFSISPTTGAISSQLLLTETTTSGGHSNAVSPCPWSDEYFALTDDEVGGIEVWRWKGDRRGDRKGEKEGEMIERVARLDLPDEKGFGMNAIWYD